MNDSSKGFKWKHLFWLQKLTLDEKENILLRRHRVSFSNFNNFISVDFVSLHFFTFNKHETFRNNWQWLFCLIWKIQGISYMKKLILPHARSPVEHSTVSLIRLWSNYTVKLISKHSFLIFGVPWPLWARSSPFEHWMFEPFFWIF